MSRKIWKVSQIISNTVRWVNSVITLIPYHIDKVNSARSKIIPIGSDIKDMGIGDFVERYCKKWKVNETKARSRK